MRVHFIISIIMYTMMMMMLVQGSNRLEIPNQQETKDGNSPPPPNFLPFESYKMLYEGRQELLDIDAMGASLLRFTMQHERSWDSEARLSFFREKPTQIKKLVRDEFLNVELRRNSTTDSFILSSARHYPRNHVENYGSKLKLRILNLSANATGTLSVCSQLEKCHDDLAWGNVPIELLFDNIQTQLDVFVQFTFIPTDPAVENLNVSFELEYVTAWYDEHSADIVGTCKVYAPAIMPPNTTGTDAGTKNNETACYWSPMLRMLNDAKYVLAQRIRPAYPMHNSVLLIRGRYRYPKQFGYDIEALILSVYYAVLGTVLLVFLSVGFGIILCCSILGGIFDRKRHSCMQQTISKV